MFTTKNEEEFLKKEINNQSKVLEYGSGESTKELASICKTIVSIEHQEDWYNKIISILPNNCKLLLKKPNSPEQWPDDGTYEQFKDYVDEPLKYGTFDVIIIDGRARVACASICNKLGHKDTIVFIHDYFRKEYHIAEKYLTLVDRVETMAKFKIKYD